MAVIIENIVKLFINDSHIATTNDQPLMTYQINKHKWSKQQWKEYYQVYRDWLIYSR